jgi:hypothetical protein
VRVRSSAANRTSPRVHDQWTALQTPGATARTRRAVVPGLPSDYRAVTTSVCSPGVVGTVTSRPRLVLRVS